MAEYVALDVSLQSTSVHVVDERGRCLWRGKCPTDIGALSSTIRRHAPEVERVGLETGMLATWLCHGLAEAGLPPPRACCARSLRESDRGSSDP